MDVLPDIMYAFGPSLIISGCSSSNSSSTGPMIGSKIFSRETIPEKESPINKIGAHIDVNQAVS